MLILDASNKEVPGPFTSIYFQPWEVRKIIDSKSSPLKKGDIGVEPKNRGILPPKWMVKIMENLVKMYDLGGPPRFLETPIC